MYEEAKILVLIILQISQSVWKNVGVLLRPTGLLKLMRFSLNFLTISIQRVVHYLSNLMKYTYSTGLCLDASESISFKFSTVMPFIMTLTFI